MFWRSSGGYLRLLSLSIIPAWWKQPGRLRLSSGSWDWQGISESNSDAFSLFLLIFFSVERADCWLATDTSPREAVAQDGLGLLCIVLSYLSWHPVLEWMFRFSLGQNHTTVVLSEKVISKACLDLFHNSRSSPESFLFPSTVNTKLAYFSIFVPYDLADLYSCLTSVFDQPVNGMGSQQKAWYFWGVAQPKVFICPSKIY